MPKVALPCLASSVLRQLVHHGLHIHFVVYQLFEVCRIHSYCIRAFASRTVSPTLGSVMFELFGGNDLQLDVDYHFFSRLQCKCVCVQMLIALAVYTFGTHTHTRALYICDFSPSRNFKCLLNDFGWQMFKQMYPHVNDVTNSTTVWSILQFAQGDSLLLFVFLEWCFHRYPTSNIRCAFIPRPNHTATSVIVWTTTGLLFKYFLVIVTHSC